MTVTPSVLSSPEGLARIRSGTADLDEWLGQWSDLPGAAWRDAMRAAVMARQLGSLTTLLAHAPADWATAGRSAQNGSFHGILSGLQPIEDQGLTAEMALVLAPHLPDAQRSDLLNYMGHAPRTLEALWPHLMSEHRASETRAESNWARHWFKENQPAMLDRWLTLNHPSGPVVEGLIYWALAKPYRTETPLWSVVMAHWTPSAPETPRTTRPAALVATLSKDNCSTALLATLKRLHQLGLPLDELPHQPPGTLLRKAWMADRVEEAAVLLALTPPEAAVRELGELLACDLQTMDQSLELAQGSADPHGHLDRIAHQVDTSRLPRWQAFRQRLARQAQLATRPASGARPRRRS